MGHCDAGCSSTRFGRSERGPTDTVKAMRPSTASVVARAARHPYVSGEAVRLNEGHHRRLFCRKPPAADACPTGFL